jgi:hypothetical protein
LKKYIFLTILSAIILLTISLLYFFVWNPTDNKERSSETLERGREEQIHKDVIYQEYIVKEQDTLDSIAQEFNLRKETLIFANDLESEGDLRAGTVLQISPVDGVLVIVEDGDSVESISKKYGANPQDVADFNWLDYPFVLEEGMELFIPSQI